jgi:phage tail-like protein
MVVSQSAPEFQLIASAPIFVISSNVQIVGGPKPLKITNLSFQELGGINSEINIETYVSVDSTTGLVNHSKQMGLTKPPTVTLKRGIDTDLSLWYWHNMALQGLPNARADVHLEMYGGGTPSISNSKPLFVYTLQNAWCAKINIAGAKAGEGFVTEDIMIACDRIVAGDG